MVDSNQASLRKGLQGYVSHQPFGGFHIPVPIQNLVLRDYAARNNKIFKLSANEYFFPNCYVQLAGLLETLDSIEGVVMCSLFLLPPDRERRIPIYERFISNGAHLHCVLESFVLKDTADIQKAEDFYVLSNVLKECPKNIPEELLPSLGGSERFS